LPLRIIFDNESIGIITNVPDCQGLGEAQRPSAAVLVSSFGELRGAVQIIIGSLVNSALLDAFSAGCSKGTSREQGGEKDCVELHDIELLIRYTDDAEDE